MAAGPGENDFPSGGNLKICTRLRRCLNCNGGMLPFWARGSWTPVVPYTGFHSAFIPRQGFIVTDPRLFILYPHTQTWGLTNMGGRPSSKPPSRNQDYSNQILAGNRLRQQGWRAFDDFDASSSRAVYLVTGSTPGLRWNGLIITTGRQDGGTHLRPRLLC